MALPPLRAKRGRCQRADKLLGRLGRRSQKEWEKKLHKRSTKLTVTHSRLKEHFKEGWSKSVEHLSQAGRVRERLQSRRVSPEPGPGEPAEGTGGPEAETEREKKEKEEESRPGNNC